MTPTSVRLIFLSAMDRVMRGLAMSVLCRRARSSVGTCQSEDCRSPWDGGGSCRSVPRFQKGALSPLIEERAVPLPGPFYKVGTVQGVAFSYGILDFCPPCLQLQQQPVLGPMAVSLFVGWGTLAESFY